ncbi:putative mediator of rna polymerase ii transcription subunit 14 protein [Zalerion maritima]|uniref:Mediator of RNA polymerase II transcription subunit 14 n=1 Tax=Zalerion maritima TaxID=339359 RepID=A0AAD5RW76_9PEZI|nr:putative mediator of rna polymerase ii transcription subunit 14 protein [Zalerion maritima]
MPAVVLAMENGIQNGVRTNHDRDIRQNGAVTTSDSKPPAGITNRNLVLPHHSPKPPKSADPNRFNELPDEIPHITQGFVPVGLLLSRLAQRSHNELREAIMEMAQIPVAKQHPNGNSVPPSSSNLPDDDSKANLQKKGMILTYAQRQHENWVKALIIAHWSRDAKEISKLIDLVNHMWAQNDQYITIRNTMVENKESFTFARLPPPDLKTGLQVLSYGTFPALPDFGFIDPPPLPAREQCEFLDNLDTLLSMRLNIDDHDKIPYHFRNFRVHDGRVTFTVKGEFEVALTIADENFTKQYWFVGFRFLFKPEPTNWTPRTEQFIEAKVNEALFNDGLDGCYRMLHEYVLTYKINEYRRQALELQKQKWVGTLGVEALNRASGIQYWVGRYRNGPKSWIILGASANKKPGQGDASDSVMPDRSTSSVSIRWFRDSVEVKDANITLDTERVSTDSLLRAVTGRHVQHILSTIHRKLLARPRFAARELGTRLAICQDDAGKSSLSIDLDRDEELVVKMDPITGFFALSPQTKITATFESRLNTSIKEPTEEGVFVMENIRTHYFMEELRRRGRSVGWETSGMPVKAEDIRLTLGTRENAQYVWFKRPGWESRWYVMLALGVSGDRWYLMDLAEKERRGGARLSTDNTIQAYVGLKVSAGHPDLNDEFFSDLETYVTGIMTHIVDLTELHRRKIPARFTQMGGGQSISPHIKMPSICIRLSSLLSDSSRNQRKPWAKDLVTLDFRGLHRLDTDSDAPRRPDVHIIAEARLTVTDKPRFSLLKGNVDEDILFNQGKGTFCLQIRSEIGKTVIETLSSRLRAIERLMNFVEAVCKAGPAVQSEAVTLRQIVFTYGDKVPTPSPQHQHQRQSSKVDRWKATVDLSDPKRVRIHLDDKNPHVRVLDYLDKLANSPKDFEKLPKVLATTLSLYVALDKMEEAWSNVSMQTGKIHFTILLRSLDWVGFRMQINTRAPNKPFVLSVEIKFKNRMGDAWWRIRRVVVPEVPATGAGGGTQPQQPQALDSDNILRVSWDKAKSRDPRIKRLGDACAAKPDSVGSALFALTHVIRACLGLDKQQPQQHKLQQQGQGQGQQQQQAGPAVAAAMKRQHSQQPQHRQQQHSQGQAPVAPMMGIPSPRRGSGSGGMANVRPGGNGNANAPFVLD